jgi:predicted TIM-barrel fold metal-dependent hydrolase
MNERRRRLAFAIFVVALVLAAGGLALRRARDAELGPRPEDFADIPVFDAHVHLEGPLPRLLALMETYRFQRVINLSGGRAHGGLARQVALARQAEGRVVVFARLAYEYARSEVDYGERMAAAQREAHGEGARGLKIHKKLGLELRDMVGDLIPVDAAELDPVFEAAGALHMPVAIHSGDPKAFWLPVDRNNERYEELRAHPDWSLSGKPVPSFDEILNQLERRIGRHPKTTFIAVHFGNCAEDPERVARMLRSYPNMYIDTAARIPEIGRHDPAKMRRFFIEFQDRVLFGSDLGVGPEGRPLWLGSRGKAAPTARDEALFFRATRRYFETADRNFAHPSPIQGDWTISGVNLPREVLEKIYHRNAERLLGLSP